MKLKQMLNEAAHIDKMVADAFTRFLIGDSNAALRALTKLKDADKGILIETDSTEYNKQYDRIFQEISKIIRRG